MHLEPRAALRADGDGQLLEYAVRHPERVTHLILFGGYAAGWRIDATDETIREREAVMTLTSLHFVRRRQAA